MSQMSTDQILNEVQDFKKDISMLDEQLERFIELFQIQSKTLKKFLKCEFIKVSEQFV